MNTARRACEDVGGYVPTKADLLRLKMDVNSFKMTGDRVFHTLQGEGNSVWLQATFIRLTNCNLSCLYCDSYYSWKKDSSEYYAEANDIAISSLTEEIIKAQQEKWLTVPCRRVVFTGGEPLLQMSKIERWGRENPSFEIHIETNGTIAPSQWILEHCHISCSPKTQNSWNTKERRFKPDALIAIMSAKSFLFKFVVSSQEDITEVLTDFSMIPREKIYFMAEGVTEEGTARKYKELASRILSEGVNATPRFHATLFDGAKRAV